MQARRIQTIFSHINPRNIEKIQNMATSAGLNSEELRQLINRQLQVDGLQIVSGTQIQSEFMDILTPAALRFVANLNRKFNGRRLELLARRTERQKEIDAGKFPTFLSETKHIRDGDWKVAPIPKDIQDRRVEITGPVDRKMVINALNSGASCFMADFEDSHTPTFENNIYGHINMRDAVLKTISFKSPEGKEYKLNQKTAVLFVRPRGWHLNEKCITLDGVQISGSLYDFGLFFFHNVKALLESGSGPYFYLPKMESHLEARLWNDVFNFAQDELGIPRGTIRATVLIETILAAFEMDEILYELRDHSAGLNCGRWDYIFSYIKKFRNHPQLILPERGQVTMTVPFMKAYVDLLIKTCHKRGIHAMGGMAAQIPVRDNPELNKLAMDKVTADKLREVTAGHDGTWVAHPGLVPLAKKVFDEHMKTPNQIHVSRSEVQVSAEELITPFKGTITAAGIRSNLEVGIRYMEAWLRGVGCVPIHNMMEDAATAEISRSQVWQWIRHGAKTTDGTLISVQYIQAVYDEVMTAIRKELGAKYGNTKFDLAGQLVLQMSIGEYKDFLTTVAYENMN